MGVDDYSSYDLIYEMMKSFISANNISVALLFPSVGRGNVDGNGVICEQHSGHKLKAYPHIFMFENGLVQHNGMMVGNDVIIATNGKTFPIPLPHQQSVGSPQLLVMTVSFPTLFKQRKSVIKIGL